MTSIIGLTIAIPSWLLFGHSLSKYLLRRSHGGGLTNNVFVSREGTIECMNYNLEYCNCQYCEQVVGLVWRLCFCVILFALQISNFVICSSAMCTYSAK